jgi:biotin carboxyl carrier protein
VVVTAKLAVAAPSVEVVVMAADGAIAWLADAGAEVAEGDRVVKLKDFDRWERKLREYKAREEHYQGKLDRANEKLEQAKAAGNQVDAKRYEGEVARYQAKVDEKKTLFSEAREALMQSELKAPVTGTVEQVVRVGAFVKSGAPVVKINAAPALEATFTLPKGKAVDAYPEGEEVALSGKADPNVELTCSISASAGDSVTVACPTDGELAEGDEVVLK